MHEASRRLSSTLDPSEVREALHRLVAEAMPCDGLLVSSYDPEERLIRCEYAWADGRLLDPATLPPLPLNERAECRAR
jgi:hypothetical protein